MPSISRFARASEIGSSVKCGLPSIILTKLPRFRVPNIVPPFGSSPLTLFVLMTAEIINGLFIGMISRFLVSVTHVAGMIMAAQSSLATATMFDVNQASQQSFQAMVEGVSPLLWNSVMKFVLNQPAWAVLGLLGIVLMLLFRSPKPLIGYSRN